MQTVAYFLDQMLMYTYGSTAHNSNIPNRNRPHMCDKYIMRQCIVNYRCCDAFAWRMILPAAFVCINPPTRTHTHSVRALSPETELLAAWRGKCIGWRSRLGTDTPYKHRDEEIHTETRRQRAREIESEWARAQVRRIVWLLCLNDHITYSCAYMFSFECARIGPYVWIVCHWCDNITMCAYICT